MATHIGNIQGKIRSKRVLDAKVPVLHVRVTEVRVDKRNVTLSRVGADSITALDCVRSRKNGLARPVILPIRGEDAPRDCDVGHRNVAGAWLGHAVNYDRRSGWDRTDATIGGVLAASDSSKCLHG